jgi:hypothetical protein
MNLVRYALFHLVVGSIVLANVEGFATGLAPQTLLFKTYSLTDQFAQKPDLRYAVGFKEWNEKRKADAAAKEKAKKQTQPSAADGAGKDKKAPGTSFQKLKSGTAKAIDKTKNLVRRGTEKLKSGTAKAIDKTKNMVRGNQEQKTDVPKFSATGKSPVLLPGNNAGTTPETLKQKQQQDRLRVADALKQKQEQERLQAAEALKQQQQRLRAVESVANKPAASSPPTYTFSPTVYGTVEVFQNGKRISTGTPEFVAQQYGYKLPNTSARTPTAVTTPMNPPPTMSPMIERGAVAASSVKAPVTSAQPSQTIQQQLDAARAKAATLAMQRHIAAEAARKKATEQAARNAAIVKAEQTPSNVVRPINNSTLIPLPKDLSSNVVPLQSNIAGTTPIRTDVGTLQVLDATGKWVQQTTAIPGDSIRNRFSGNTGKVVGRGVDAAVDSLVTSGINSVLPIPGAGTVPGSLESAHQIKNAYQKSGMLGVAEVVSNKVATTAGAAVGCLKGVTVGLLVGGVNGAKFGCHAGAAGGAAVTAASIEMAIRATQSPIATEPVSKALSYIDVRVGVTEEGKAAKRSKEATVELQRQVDQMKASKAMSTPPSAFYAENPQRATPGMPGPTGPQSPYSGILNSINPTHQPTR